MSQTYQSPVKDGTTQTHSYKSDIEFINAYKVLFKKDGMYTFTRNQDVLL